MDQIKEKNRKDQQQEPTDEKAVRTKDAKSTYKDNPDAEITEADKGDEMRRNKQK